MTVQLDEAIEAYAAHRVAIGMARNTNTTTRVVLGKLLMDIGNVRVNAIHPEHMDRFFAGHQWEWKSSTCNVYRAHLAAFFRFCRSRKWLARDVEPMENLRARKVPKTNRNRIPVEDFDKTLNLCADPRERMTIATGLYLFLRSSEMALIRLADIDLDRGYVLVRVPKSKVEDVMPISSDLDDELRRWLRFYTEECGVLDGKMFLLPSRSEGFAIANRPWNPRKPIHRPGQIVSRLLGEQGYECYREGIHTLRRSGARALFDELSEVRGYDGALEIVSSMLHHELMSTTQLYLGLNESRGKRDDIIRGKQMFSRAKPGANVVQLHAVGSANAGGHGDV